MRNGHTRTIDTKLCVRNCLVQLLSIKSVFYEKLYQQIYNYIKFKLICILYALE